jgi:hypothetical protein
VPVAWAMFYPYQIPDKQWKFGTFETKVDVKVVQSETKEGNNSRYVEVNLYGKDDKELIVKDVNVDWAVKRIKDKSFNWWNPRLGLGASGTNKMIGPRIDLSIFSYGKTNVDIDWRFLSFGIGTHSDNDESEVFWSFEPFSWNLGKSLPLVENIFIGPLIVYGLDFDRSYGLGISVPF